MLSIVGKIFHNPLTKKILKILAVFTVIITVLAGILWFFLGEYFALWIVKDEVMGDGSYTFEIDCELNGNEDESLVFLEKMGITISTIHLSVDKKDDLYHGLLYVNDEDVPVIEFYEQDKEVKINISVIMRYVSWRMGDSIFSGLTSKLDVEKNIYVTDGAIEELLGKSEVKTDDFLQQFVGFNTDIKFKKVKDNPFASDKSRRGVAFEFDGGAKVTVAAKTSFLLWGKRSVYGNIQQRGLVNHFYMEYEEAELKDLEMPEEGVNALEVALAKKAVEYLYDKLLQYYNTR